MKLLDLLPNNMPSRRPSAKEMAKIKTQRAVKGETDYKTLNYSTSKIKTIGEERNRFADTLRVRNQAKKKKKAKSCAPGDMYNKHMKKNKLFGLFGKKKPKPMSAPAQFKGRMNSMKSMINDL